MCSDTVVDKKYNADVSRSRLRRKSGTEKKKTDTNTINGKKKLEELIRSKILKILPFLREQSWEPVNWWERVFVDGTFMNKLMKSFGIWFICHVIGMTMFLLSCVKYSIDPRRIAVYVVIVTEIITAMIFLFQSFKIIFLIGIPSLLTSRLRTAIIFIIIIFSIQGSAVNIDSNIMKSVEGVVCVQMKVRNLAEEVRQSTKSKIQEIPIEEARMLMKNIFKPFKVMTQTLRNIADTVSKMAEWQKMINERMLDMFEICSDMSRIPYNQCMNKLNDLYYFCLENTFDFVCQPILFLQKQCFVTRVLVPICDWPSKMKKNIQEAVVPYVKDSMKKTLDLTKNMTFYKIIAKGKNMTVGTKEAFDTLNITVKEEFAFEEKVNLRINEFKTKLRSEVAFFELILSFILWISDLMIYTVFFIPFATSVLYIIKFNRMEDIDNYFLTQELKDVDENRKRIQKTSIFSLNEEEANTYVWALSWKISSNEKLKLMIKVAMTVIGVLIPFILILIDVLTYTILDTGYEFFHSNYTMMTKPSIYQLKISGTGFLNALLSNILEVFQPMNSVTDKKDNLWRTCFEEPSPPKYKDFRLMFGLFVIAILTCFIEIYVRRLRHIIAGNYFPDRRRPRALFLYREIEDRRKNLLAETIKIAGMKSSKNKRAQKMIKASSKDQGKEEAKKNIGSSGNNMEDRRDDRTSLDLGFLVGTNRCVRCAREDLQLTPNTTRICIHCNALYCVDCFSVSRKCYQCGWPIQKVVEGTEFYVNSSGSESE